MAFWWGGGALDSMGLVKVFTCRRNSKSLFTHLPPQKLSLLLTQVLTHTTLQGHHSAMFSLST